ncbi:unnamed protein product [Paramecium pentaurelia]|uniref:Transmembrane protein n=1 Tax=Paramecium pentaurelia TaxID=43138 RepID=A0A8S1V6K4_9CILI|nr:unnamed protein product [Paramecium pentaurelia]
MNNKIHQSKKNQNFQKNCHNISLDLLLQMQYQEFIIYYLQFSQELFQFRMMIYSLWEISFQIAIKTFKNQQPYQSTISFFVGIFDCYVQFLIYSAIKEARVFYVFFITKLLGCNSSFFDHIIFLQYNDFNKVLNT